jgi:hypothetical protein
MFACVPALFLAATMMVFGERFGLQGERANLTLDGEVPMGACTVTSVSATGGMSPLWMESELAISVSDSSAEILPCS